MRSYLYRLRKISHEGAKEVAKHIGDNMKNLQSYTLTYSVSVDFSIFRRITFISPKFIYSNHTNLVFMKYFRSRKITIRESTEYFQIIGNNFQNLRELNLSIGA